MKKIFALLLTICMVFSLVACDTNGGTPQGGSEQGSNTGGGDVTNVSTDGEVKLNNVIGDGTPQGGNEQGDNRSDDASTNSEMELNNVSGEGSLTVVVKENSFEVTLTHPKINLEFLENDGHVGASFDMADDERLIYLYADIHASEDSYFTSNLHDFQNGKRHDAKYIVEEGSIKWIDLSVPYDITQAETIYMTVGTTALDYEHYYAYYKMEDVLTFDE